MAEHVSPGSGNGRVPDLLCHPSNEATLLMKLSLALAVRLQLADPPLTCHSCRCCHHLLGFCLSGFCSNELADWKMHLTPWKELKPEVSQAQPIMVVYFEGQIHRIPVKQGPDGLGRVHRGNQGEKQGQEPRAPPSARSTDRPLPWCCIGCQQHGRCPLLGIKA